MLIKNIILKLNGAFTDMKKTITLFILILSSQLCKAQQRISFIENNTYKTITHTLPQEVKCIDVFGNHKKMVLEKVVDNILFFKDLKIKDKEFKCKYSDLKSIRFYKKNQEFNQCFAYSFGASAVYFGLLSVLSLGAIASHVSQEDGYLYIMAGFSTPVAILSGVIAHVNNKEISKPIPRKNWKLLSEDDSF